MQLRQQGRPVRVTTNLGPDVVVVERMVVEEFVSAPFRIQLDLLSTNPSIKTKPLMRTPVVLEVDVPGGGVRYFHGMISRFSQGGRTGELTRYRCEAVPQAGLAGLYGDNRIFQKKKVPEIIEAVLKGAKVTNFSLTLAEQYAVRDYTVQFNESNLDFLSRLLEDEGIFYFHRHSKSGHELVIGDRNSVFQPCPGAGQVRIAGQEATTASDIVREMLRESAVHVGQVSMTDYNYMQPGLELGVSVKGATEGEEVYVFPGGYAKPEDGEKRSRLLLDAHEALEHTAYGQGSVRGFTAGGRFQLRDHWDPGANIEWVLLNVRHLAVQAGFRAGESETFTYENEFAAIPCSVPYRPLPRTPKPQVRGMQTAVVVGPKNEEIYTDEHGRVKIHFHWDRLGKKDENSSCWVRVSSPWAGKGWGAVHIPRIGQEVVVDFINGDVDQPIIVGRVYNGDQTPPYALPANKTQSGVKSRSTKDGGTEDYNELRFEDKQGSEEVYLHAQKNFRRWVENDETATVEHDQFETIKGQRSITIKEGNDTLYVEEGDHKFSVIQGKHTASVKMDHETTVEDGHFVTEVGKGDHETKVKMGKMSTAVDMGDHETKVKMGNYSIKCDLGKVTIEAMQEIELKVGQSVVKISQMGVEVKGMMNKIDGTVQTDVKGLMMNVQGQAMTTVKGAITMIN